MRQLVASASPLASVLGMSRAVRVGSWVVVAGTAPIATGGGIACPGDVYGQTRRCLDITRQAILEAGLSLDSVVRTRIMLTDISRWRESARAHCDFFADIKPACTFVEVKGFIEPEWLVEVETDCIADTAA
jgi:enamine deaminase RidA (YjgF/YER057c/UK114 family)